MEDNVNKISIDFIIWFDNVIDNSNLVKIEPGKFWFREDGAYYQIEEIFELYNRFRKN